MDVGKLGDYLAPLQVVDYNVDFLDYRPGSPKPIEERDLEVYLDLNFLPDTLSGEGHGMSMTLDLYEREDLKLSIKVIGHFQFIDSPSERPEPQHVRTFFFTTSIGTLYGIVREKVRDITAQSTLNGDIIPSVNLGAITEELEQEENLEHFKFEDEDGDTSGG